MNWKWNNLLIFHKQNEQHYWLGLLNILGLLKKKQKQKNPENFFGIFLNRTIHNKPKKNPLSSIYPSLDDPSTEFSSISNMDWLYKGKLQYLSIWRGPLLEHSFMSLPLLYLHRNLHSGFYLVLLWLFSYVHSTVLTQCLLLQKVLLPNFSFPFNFFWKLEFFHHLHLFYINHLLIFRCVSHLLLPSQLQFNSLKHTILKTSQNVMYGVNLWNIEKHCNAAESRAYTGCSTQFTKGILRT